MSQQAEHVQDNALERTDSRAVSSAAQGMSEAIGENFVASTHDAMPKTSVSSVSVAAGSSDTSKPTEEVSRPSDEDIIAHENAIRATVAERMPFVGDVEPLSALEAEYAAGSGVFVSKIRSLGGRYRGIRRTRGDGNCFFRSFLFAYLESLAERRDGAERDRLLQRLSAARTRLTSAGFQELVFEEGLDLLQGWAASVPGGSGGSPPGVAPSAAPGTVPLTVPSLEVKIRDATLSNTAVMLLRFVTSAELQLREDHFAPFVLGMSDDPLTVEGFCRRCVEPMGEESDHVHIVALTDALQVPIRVVYLDSAPGLGGLGGGPDPAAVTEHDFKPEGVAETAPPLVHLLYRPGHFDILYPKP